MNRYTSTLKQMARCLAAGLVAFATLTCMPGRCLAGTYSNFTYSVSGTSVTITGYLGRDTAITIPSKIPSVGTVTSIEARAFFNTPNYTSVAIPNNVTIGYQAFYACNRLSNVTIGTNASIGSDAFADCMSLASVTIGKDVNTIGDEAFSFCYHLASVLFLGNAPPLGSVVFNRSPVTIYYLPSNTGWTTPTWLAQPPGGNEPYSCQSAFPSIAAQPSSLTWPPGRTATFGIQASGFSLGYQWQWNGVNLTNDGRISGSCSSTLTLADAQTNDAGRYMVIVSNLFGTATSQVATLTFAATYPPWIVTQPSSQSVPQGNTATFCVVASASPSPSYHWYANGTNLMDGGRISGCESSKLTIASVQTNDAAAFSVVVSNSLGVVTSEMVTLTVWVPPSITQQPVSLTVTQGNAATFSVAAGGIPSPGFQWRSNGGALGNGGRVSGADSSTLTITGVLTNDAVNYTAVATSVAGSVTSQVATLTVLAPPAFTSGTSVSGIQGVALNFTNTAGGTVPITFYSGVLPAGLSLTSSNGVISGFPVVSGVYQVITIASNAIAQSTNVLQFNLSSGAPGITGVLTAVGKQGTSFTYTITASNNPTWLFATGLPAGVTVNGTNGFISGIPAVSGVFPVLIGATNRWGTGTNTLTLTLTTGIPGITSALADSGKQGQAFSYTIMASNSPISFSASGLPTGLSLNATNGVISGTPWVSGTFSVVVGAANEWGADSRALTLTVASGVPVITSATSASGSENASFSYQITATETPTSFGAAGLPLGLTLNTNNGAISGNPMYGGPFDALIWARNTWGTGSNTLHLDLSYAPITGLSIGDVGYDYWSAGPPASVPNVPYLVDFAFSLRDNTNAALGHAVVRSVTNLVVTCAENGTNISPSETAYIVAPGNKKQLKSFLVLDYTASMELGSPDNPVPDSDGDGISDAIENMETAAKAFINQQPADAQVGIYEFHAEFVAPNQVKSLTSNKEVLCRAIDGILSNYVQSMYASTRCWDALLAALGDYGAANRDEQRYIIFMSDGTDESSVNGGPADIVAAAQAKKVKLYCVAFGNSINTTTLQGLTSQTQGRYYAATNANDLAAAFAQVAKDLDGQYLLRWATLKRSATAFRPSFTVRVGANTASFNGNPLGPIEVPNYVPTMNAGNVLVGELLLVPDAETSPSTVTLRASYVPRYIRRIRLHYRANYPCVANLKYTAPGEIMRGWSLTQTNDGTGGVWLELLSPPPQALTNSIPYGVMGNLLQFSFRDLPSKQQAFSVFEVDNSIYQTAGGQSWALGNTNQFITWYTNTPHGTPITWLQSFGFTNDFAAAELSDPDGDRVPTWQEYWAGTNPRDKDSAFTVRPVSAPTGGQPFQMSISTVVGRTYRVETSTSFGSWSVLQDSIVGTGGLVTVTDNRNLAGVKTVFYRVAVY